VLTEDWLAKLNDVIWGLVCDAMDLY